MFNIPEYDCTSLYLNIAFKKFVKYFNVYLVFLAFPSMLVSNELFFFQFPLRISYLIILTHYADLY